MKLESKECKTILKNYPVKNDLEKLAIKVLLAKDEDVVNLPGIEEMDNAQIDELANAIGQIRDNIGIENEA